MCILVLAEDLEARAPKSSAQTKISRQHTASEGASHARRATGLAETAGAGWVSSKSVPTENPRCFHYLEQSDRQEKFSMFQQDVYYCCIAAVLLYQYRQFDGRHGKNENYVIVTTRPEP